MSDPGEPDAIVELVDKIVEKYSSSLKKKKTMVAGKSISLGLLRLEALKELVGYSDREVVELAKTIISKTYRLLVIRRNISLGIVLKYMAPIYLKLYNPNPKLNMIIVYGLLKELGLLDELKDKIRIDWRTALLLDGQTAYSDLDGIHVTQYFLLDYLFLRKVDEKILEIKGVSKERIEEIMEPLYHPLSTTYALAIILHELLHLALAHNVQTSNIIRNALATYGDKGYNVAYAVANIVADLFVNKILTRYLSNIGLLDKLKDALNYILKTLGASKSERELLLSSISYENYNVETLENYSKILTGDTKYIFTKSFSETIMKFVEDYMKREVEIKAVAYKHSPIIGGYKSTEIDIEKERLMDYFVKGYTTIKIGVKRKDDGSLYVILNNILNNETEKIINTTYGVGGGNEIIIIINSVKRKRIEKWLEAKSKALSNRLVIVNPNYAKELLMDIRGGLTNVSAGLGTLISEFICRLELGEYHYTLPWVRDLYNNIRRLADSIIYKYTFNPPNTKYLKRIGSSNVMYYKMKKQQRSLLDILLLIDISGSMMEEDTLRRVFRVIRDIYNNIQGIRVYLFWWMSGYAELAGELRGLAKEWFTPTGEAKIELPGTGGTEIRPVLETILKLSKGEKVKPVEKDYLTYIEGEPSIDLSRSIVIVITDSEIFDIDNEKTIDLLVEVANMSHRVYWLTTLSKPEFDDPRLRKLLRKEKIKIYYIGEKSILEVY